MDTPNTPLPARLSKGKPLSVGMPFLMTRRNRGLHTVTIVQRASDDKYAAMMQRRGMPPITIGVGFTPEEAHTNAQHFMRIGLPKRTCSVGKGPVPKRLKRAVRMVGIAEPRFEIPGDNDLRTIKHDRA